MNFRIITSARGSQNAPRTSYLKRKNVFFKEITLKFKAGSWSESKFQVESPSDVVANQIFVSPEKLAKWPLLYFGQKVTNLEEQKKKSATINFTSEMKCTKTEAEFLSNSHNKKSSP